MNTYIGYIMDHLHRMDALPWCIEISFSLSLRAYTHNDLSHMLDCVLDLRVFSVFYKGQDDLLFSVLGKWLFPFISPSHQTAVQRTLPR